jgi:D-inositol-3-phosphate glycosyltransferase
MTEKAIALIDPVGGKAGMDFYDTSLLKSLVDQGFSTLLFANFKAASPGIESYHSFHNMGVNKIRAIFNNFINFIKALIICRNRKISWLILHLFRGGLFDLVTIGLSRLMGFRILLIIHDVKSLDTIALPVTRKIILNHFNHSKLVHNRYSYNKLAEQVKPSKMGNVHIIPHGNFIELANHPVAASSVADLEILPGKRYLLFFGQLKKVKGLDVLIRAMGLARSDFQLIIAGRNRDDNFSSYHQLIKETGTGNRVIAINRFITNEERDFMFRACEAVIVPYKRVYQSGVLLMAMSYGKTVVASGLEPFLEMIRHEENGLLFPPGDHQTLANLIDSLYDGMYDEKILGNNAFQYVKEANSWQMIGKAYARILET